MSRIVRFVTGVSGGLVGDERSATNADRTPEYIPRGLSIVCGAPPSHPALRSRSRQSGDETGARLAVAWK